MGFLPTHKDRSVFVSWWRYTSRPESFAEAMGAENYFFAQGEQLGLLKYVPRALSCFWTLIKRRPRLVFASNPPTFAPLIVWFYCLIFDARYCMDSHTSAFDRVRWLRLMPLHAFLARRAIWAATTNDELTDRVNAFGAPGISVTDIPFEFPQASYPVKDGFSVAVVSSFDDDEPVAEVVEAARRTSDVTFYVTGNPAKAPEDLRASCPENVILTGYLSNEDYIGLLRSVSAIMVLTTNDLTMQRGGSEAISVERPLITSDFQVLRDIFYKGTVHVDNSPESLVSAIDQIRNDLPRYEAEMTAMKHERDERWAETRTDLLNRIASALD